MEKLHCNLRIFCRRLPAIVMSDFSRLSFLILPNHLSNHRKDFHRYLYGLRHTFCSIRAESELLNAHEKVSVPAAVNTVESRDRKRLKLSARQIAVKWLLTDPGGRFQAGDGSSIDRVPPQPRLVRRSVQLNHPSVDRFLICHIHADDSRANDTIYIINGLIYAHPVKTSGVIVHQNDRFVHADGCPAQTALIRLSITVASFCFIYFWYVQNIKIAHIRSCISCIHTAARLF